MWPPAYIQKNGALHSVFTVKVLRGDSDGFFCKRSCAAPKCCFFSASHCWRHLSLLMLKRRRGSSAKSLTAIRASKNHVTSTAAATGGATAAAMQATAAAMAAATVRATNMSSATVAASAAVPSAAPRHVHQERLRGAAAHAPGLPFNVWTRVAPSCLRRSAPRYEVSSTLIRKTRRCLDYISTASFSS